MVGSRQLLENSGYIDRNDTGRSSFVPLPPGDQNTATVKQFRELGRVLQLIEKKLDEYEARLSALEP